MENRVPAPIESVIVVGTGLAGLRTTSELRAQGFTGRITVVGTEPHLPYDRPPLSKKLLAHSEPVFLHDDLGVLLHDLTPDVLVHHTVTDISCVPRPTDAAGPSDAGPAPVAAVTVVPVAEDGALGNERVLLADAIVLAVGSAPFIPPHWAGTHKLYTWDDAVRLRSALDRTTKQNVVIIGAGWIGAELATVAAQSGHRVTVVEAQSTALAAQLGQHVGAVLSQWYEDAGIRLLTSTSVERVSIEPNSLRRVTLATGDVLTADIVITAVGARPATSWLPQALPRSSNGAIKTNQWGQVSVSGQPEARVFAVGDCAEREDAVFTTVPGGHWNTALQDPARVAAAITGSWQLPRPHAPHVFSTQLGHEINLFGLPDVAADEVLIRPGVSADGSDWVGLYVDPSAQLPPGRIMVTGIFTVDAPRLASQARKLMTAGPVDLDRDKALDPSIQLKAAV